MPSSTTASAEKLLFSQGIGNNQQIRIWSAHPESHLRLVPQEHLANDPAKWPAHNGPEHWGDFLTAVPGSPNYALNLGSQYWNGSLSPRDDFLTRNLRGPELYVATLATQDLDSENLSPDEKWLAYAALLQHDMLTGFDPSLPSKIAQCAPWLSLGIKPLANYPVLPSLIRRAIKDRALALGFDTLYDRIPMPSSGFFPKDWHGSPCRPVALVDYCQHIPTLAGKRTGSELVISFSLRPNS